MHCKLELLYYIQADANCVSASKAEVEQKISLVVDLSDERLLDLWVTHIFAAIVTHFITFLQSEMNLLQ